MSRFAQGGRNVHIQVERDRDGRMFRRASAMVMDRLGGGDVGDSPQASCFGTSGSYRLRHDNQRPRGTATGFVGRARAMMRGRGGMAINRLANRKAQWAKVVLAHCASLGPFTSIGILSEALDETLYPLLVNVNEGGDITFFIDRVSTCDAIRSIANRLERPDGTRLRCFVTKVSAPLIELARDHQDIVKECIVARFDPSQQTLDISDLRADVRIKNENLSGQINLQRNAAMLAVSKIVLDVCPDIIAINMAANRVRNLDYFASLVYRTPRVKHLFLQQNQIDNIKELQKLKGWNLIELNLDKNPICAQYPTHDSYISALRKIFPKLVVLDSVELPPPIGFDLEDEVGTSKSDRLPPIKSSFVVPNTGISSVVEQFIKQYYTLYDADDRSAREQLLNAYSQNATFTLNAAVLKGIRTSDSTTWITHLRDSHNILFKDKWERYRAKLIKKGHLAIVAFLKEMPRTRHDMDNVIVDVSFVSDNYLCLNVSGIYQEIDSTGSSDETFKMFNRVFMVVPAGSGVSIVNEMLFVSLVNEEMAKSFAAISQKAKMNSATDNTVDQMAAMLNGVGAAAAPAVASNPQQVMVQQLRSQTGLNAEWAEKCLAENGWDYQLALDAFSRVKGSVPPEAFA